MISPTFYVKNNAVKTYFGGKVSHYAIKDKSTVIGTYDYILSYGEDMYSIAETLFGQEKQYLWTVLADINPLRDPFDWSAGDVIKIPLLIVNEGVTLKRLING